MSMTRTNRYKAGGRLSGGFPAASTRLVAILSAIIFAAAMFSSPIARADGGSEIVWTVSKVRGTVSYRESGQEGLRWIPLRSGALLASLAQIKTGPDGHAELTYENSTIIAAPGSEMQLPGPTPKGAVYRVSQRLGTFLYKIKHATRDKFEVQTPYLTTIIKGTIFSVLAGPNGSSVHVTEGAVFVRPFSGEGGSFVRPGETARINNSDRSRVTIQGARNNPGRSAPSTEDNGSRANGGGNSTLAPANSGPGNSGNAANAGPKVKILFRDAPAQNSGRQDFTNTRNQGSNSVSGTGSDGTANRGQDGKGSSGGGKGLGSVGGGSSGNSGNGNSGGSSSSASLGSGSSGGASSGAGLGGGSSGGNSGASLGGGGNSGGNSGASLSSSNSGGNSGPSLGNGHGNGNGGGNVASNGKGKKD
jgi:hypothetical protein